MNSVKTVVCRIHRVWNTPTSNVPVAFFVWSCSWRSLISDVAAGLRWTPVRAFPRSSAGWSCWFCFISLNVSREAGRSDGKNGSYGCRTEIPHHSSLLRACIWVRLCVTDSLPLSPLRHTKGKGRVPESAERCGGEGLFERKRTECFLAGRPLAGWQEWRLLPWVPAPVRLWHAQTLPSFLRAEWWHADMK